MRLLSLVALMVFIASCGEEKKITPPQNNLEILGYETQESRVVVNFAMDAHAKDNFDLLFSVMNDSPRVLFLQLDTGIEIAPDIDETLKLAKTCGDRYFTTGHINISCQVAFSLPQGRSAKKLYYRYFTTEVSAPLSTRS